MILRNQHHLAFEYQPEIVVQSLAVVIVAVVAVVIAAAVVVAAVVEGVEIAAVVEVDAAVVDSAFVGLEELETLVLVAAERDLLHAIVVLRLPFVVEPSASSVVDAVVDPYQQVLEIEQMKKM